MHIYDVEVGPLHIKKTKICQRSYSTVFNDLSKTKK
jgi:hypothetical protein